MSSMINHCLIAVRAALVLLVMLPGATWAKGTSQDDKELGLVRALKVFVSDNVTDRCLPQPDLLRTDAEAVLRGSGIAVQAEAVYALSINATGHAWQDGCVAFLRAEVWRAGFVQPDNHAVVIQIYSNSALLADEKPSIQCRLREKLSEFVTDLAYQILNARQSGR